jgi:6-phosphogluconate dehydrogenase
MSGSAEVGVTGLGVMGSNLARNLAHHDYTVAVHNRTASRTRQFMDRFGSEGAFVAVESPKEFVASLERPRKIIVMVNAGPPVDAVLDELVPLVDRGDVVVDGGNSHFDDTRRREAALREAGLHLVGTGISGGEEGALNGPSIMPGGSEEGYAAVGPMFERIAAVYLGTPCSTHVGPDGAGHFVKMVHNGIEYADMQLIGEAYDVLRQGLGVPPAELAGIFEQWNEGDLDSFLIQITAKVLAHVDQATGRPFVDVVLDQAEQKGTGRWTVQTALELGVPVTGIAEAVFARVVSAHPDQRRAAAGLPGPAGSVPSGLVQAGQRQQLIDDVRQALYASKVVAYAQGFWQMAAGSDQYSWGIDLGAMATIWRAGCIIRARFLDRIRDAYASDPRLPNLLVDAYFSEAVEQAQEGWRRVVGTAASIGVPVPGFSSALAYYDQLRRERLPAALIQGLRDYFGAHTYRRVDRDGVFHTLWGGDRTEVEAG